MIKKNPIAATIDFAKDGIQHGFLRMPYSRNDSAWGAIMIPITQMKNGKGPTALITGGNHGDEYEGPLALYEFVGRSEFDDINGRVIVIPAMNYPAFQNASRVSPIDSGNMNRLFPGKTDGTVTEVIADYFTRTLLPLADFVLDFHSGGKTLEFLPFSACHQLDDKTQERRNEAAMQAFHAPYTLKMLEQDASKMYDTQAESKGKVFVTTELGGGGTTTPYTVDIARRGLTNFLIHADILKGELSPCPEGTIQLRMSDDQSFIFCQHAGLLEPCVSLGDTVKEGDLMARIHIIERTAMPPYDYNAPTDGLVIARHFPSLAKMGDTLYVIAQKIAGFR